MCRADHVRYEVLKASIPRRKDGGSLDHKEYEKAAKRAAKRARV